MNPAQLLHQMQDTLGELQRLTEAQLAGFVEMMYPELMSVTGTQQPFSLSFAREIVRGLDQNDFTRQVELANRGYAVSRCPPVPPFHTPTL